MQVMAHLGAPYRFQGVLHGEAVGLQTSCMTEGLSPELNKGGGWG